MSTKQSASESNWRWLADGEIVEAGDEVLDDLHGWIPVSYTIGRKVGSLLCDQQYRRRTPETQKRATDEPQSVITELAKLYGELREIIDDGSESMTHEDALEKLKRMVDAGTSDNAPGEDYHVPIEPEPKRAKVGDWVRCSSGSVFQVNGVFDNHVSGEDAGKYCSATHNFYEIVRRVVRPWTRSEAMKALADVSELRRIGNSSPLVKMFGVNNYGVYIESHRIWSRPNFEQVSQKYTLPNGEPCGVVEWEVEQ